MRQLLHSNKILGWQGWIRRRPWWQSWCSTGIRGSHKPFAQTRRNKINVHFQTFKVVLLLQKLYLSPDLLGRKRRSKSIRHHDLYRSTLSIVVFSHFQLFILGVVSISILNFVIFLLSVNDSMSKLRDSLSSLPQNESYTMSLREIVQFLTNSAKITNKGIIYGNNSLKSKQESK